MRAAAFLAVALLVVAPWTYRNWLEFHAFVPVSTAGGQNLFQGNALIPRDTTYEMVDAVQGRVEQYHYAMRMGLQAIRDRQPWWIFEKLRDEMPLLLGSGQPRARPHQARRLRRRRARVWPWPSPWSCSRPTCWSSPCSRWALARLTWSRPRPCCSSPFLAYYNLLHVVTHGFARYRLPVMPVVFLIAGVGWVAWRRGRAARGCAAARAAAAAASPWSSP